MRVVSLAEVYFNQTLSQGGNQNTEMLTSLQTTIDNAAPWLRNSKRRCAWWLIKKRETENKNRMQSIEGGAVEK